MQARLRCALRGAAPVLALLLGGAAAAFEPEQAEIEFSGGTYSYTFSAVLDGSHDAVLAVATDYDHLARVNDSITASRVLERYGPHELERLLELRQCVLLFCFDLRFVERVKESVDGITATIVPESSSFRSGVSRWRIEPVDAAHTRMTLSATQTPDFWIPPVIGPLVLKRVFLREVRETCVNIERLARAAEDPGR